MRRLISMVAALGVAFLATGGAASAQPSRLGAIEDEQTAAEADKAAGASADFQLSHSFACPNECISKFYKVPKDKELNLTSFSCYTLSSTIYILGFIVDKSGGGTTVVTPTTNGNNLYSGAGSSPLLIKGGEKLNYVDSGNAPHSTICTIRGQLR